MKGWARALNPRLGAKEIFSHNFDDAKCSGVAMLYLPYCGRSSLFLWPSQALSLAKFTFSDLGIWLFHQNEFIFDGLQIGNGPEQWLVQKKIIKKSNYFHVFITGTKPNSCYFTSFSCQSNEPVGFLPGLFSNSSKGIFIKKTGCQCEVFGL